MAFLAQETTLEREVNRLIKARGFEIGAYEFIPNENKTDSDTVLNGTVNGFFQIPDYDLLSMKFFRKDFSEKDWKRICALFGFRYHNHNDIDSFFVPDPKKVEVEITISTAQE